MLDHTKKIGITALVTIALVSIALTATIAVADPGPPSVQTSSLSENGTIWTTLTGEVTDMGGLDEAAVWFEYRRSGETDWKTAIATDHVSSSGAYHEDPGGFAHEGGDIDYTEPIGTGESVTFVYYQADATNGFKPVLYDGPQDGTGTEISDWDERDVISQESTTLVTVEHTGSTVNIIVDGETEWTEPVDSDSIYFSSNEFSRSGQNSEKSIRLLGAAETVEQPGEFELPLYKRINVSIGDSYELRPVVTGPQTNESTTGDVQTITIESPVETIGVEKADTVTPALQGSVELGPLDSVDARFEYRENGTTDWTSTATKEVTTSGQFEIGAPLNADRTYEVRAVVEDINDTDIEVDRFSGDTVSVETGQSVVTRDPGGINGSEELFSGNVTDLGDETPAGGWFEYRRPGDSEWIPSGLDSEVTGDGGIYPNPRGYAHDGGNATYSPQIGVGNTVHLLYYKPGSSSTLKPFIRSTSSANDTVWVGEPRDVFGDDDIAIVRIANGGGEAKIDVNGGPTWNTADLDTIDPDGDLFFGTREVEEATDDESLRVVGRVETLNDPGVFDFSARENTTLNSTSDYEYRAVVNGVAGTARSPVETVSVTNVDTAGPTVTARAQIGSDTEAEAVFQYRKNGTETWQSGTNTTITESGEFSLGHPLDANTTYEVRPAVIGPNSGVFTGQAQTIETATPAVPLEADDTDSLRPTLRGEITDMGGLDEAAVWFEYREVNASDWTAVSDDETLTRPGTFDVDLTVGSDVEPNTDYEVRPVVDGAVGSTRTVHVGSPVEMESVTQLDSPAPTMTGSVDLGASESATATFEYRELEAGADGPPDWKTTANTTIEESGTFDISQQLDARTTYEVRAVVDGVRSETTTVETGDTVLTREPTGLDSMGPTLRGALFDTGGLDSVPVRFEYRETGGDWQPVYDDENITADGDYYADPGGYAHGGDNRSARLDRPIQSGESVDIVYQDPANASVQPVLRNVTDGPNATVENWTGEPKDIVGDEPTTVTVANDGSEIQIRVDDETVWTTTNFSGEAVRFSTVQRGGDTGAESLRVLGTVEYMDSPGTFERDLRTGLDVSPNTTYQVRTVADESVGRVLDVHVGSPVETIGISERDAEKPKLRGEVRLGSLDSVNVSFRYVDKEAYVVGDASIEGNTTEQVRITESGEFAIRAPLEREAPYVFVARAHPEGGDLIQGDAVDVEIVDAPRFDVSFGDDLPAYARKGGELTIPYEVENAGLQAGSQDISVTVNDEWSQIETTNLDRNEVETGEVTYPIPSTTDNLSVSVSSDNQTVNETVPVFAQSDLEDGQIVDIDHEDTVTPGEETQITVDTADAAGTVVTVDAASEVELSSEDATAVDGNRIEFFDGSDGDSTYTIEMAVSDAQPGETIEIDAWVDGIDREDAADRKTSTIDVAPWPRYDVDIQSIDESDAGEPLNVTVRASNDQLTEITDEMQLRIDESVVDNQTVSVDPFGSTTAQLTWESAPAGEHNLTVANVAGNVTDNVTIRDDRETDGPQFVPSGPERVIETDTPEPTTGEPKTPVTPDETDEPETTASGGAPDTTEPEPTQEAVTENVETPDSDGGLPVPPIAIVVALGIVASLGVFLLTESLLHTRKND